MRSAMVDDDDNNDNDVDDDEVEVVLVEFFDDTKNVEGRAVGHPPYI